MKKSLAGLVLAGAAVLSTAACMPQPVSQYVSGNGVIVKVKSVPDTGPVPYREYAAVGLCRGADGVYRWQTGPWHNIELESPGADGLYTAGMTCYPGNPPLSISTGIR